MFARVGDRKTKPAEHALDHFRDTQERNPPF